MFKFDFAPLGCEDEPGLTARLSDTAVNFYGCISEAFARPDFAQAGLLHG